MELETSRELCPQLGENLYRSGLVDSVYRVSVNLKGGRRCRRMSSSNGAEGATRGQSEGNRLRRACLALAFRISA
jgi:hypothetical protein